MQWKRSGERQGSPTNFPQTISPRSVRYGQAGGLWQGAVSPYFADGKMILFTKKNTSMDTPPLRTVVPML